MRLRVLTNRRSCFPRQLTLVSVSWIIVELERWFAFFRFRRVLVCYRI